MPAPYFFYKEVKMFENKKERWRAFLDLMRPYMHEDQRMDLMSRLDGMGYFDAPASTRFHGAYAGGLFDHSYTVTRHLVELTDRMGLKWYLDRSAVLVGLLHDLCKCDLYLPAEDGKYIYCQAADGRHGVKSMEIAKELVPDLTDEEAMCIKWHMGAYDDKGIWNELGMAIEQYHNVLWTHTADMMAARFDLT